jgi:hypothetical protein
MPELLFQQFIWDEPAQLIDHGKTATLKGRIINPSNKRMVFEVHLKLINKHDWESWNAQHRTYIAYSLQAIQTAKREHKNWTFWELSDESYLKGAGDLTGVLNLSHFPHNNKVGFQLGKGANGWDKDLGLGGLFSYKGRLTYKGKRFNVTGHGSMNVDAEPCTGNCTPLNETVSIIPQTKQQTVEIEAATEGFSIFPVPARSNLTISSKTLAAGMYTIKFYNSAGQLKKQVNMVVGQGNYVVSVDDLKPGMYKLQLISFAGKVYSKKIIIQ